MKFFFLSNQKPRAESGSSGIIWFARAPIGPKPVRNLPATPLSTFTPSFNIPL